MNRGGSTAGERGVRVLVVAILGGIFFGCLAYSAGTGVLSGLGNWPTLIGAAAGVVAGAIAGAADLIVRAIDAQTERMAGASHQPPTKPTTPGGVVSAVQKGHSSWFAS
jgi:hypothetical protein